MLKPCKAASASTVRDQRPTLRTVKSSAPRMVTVPRTSGKVVATLGVDGKVYPTLVAQKISTNPKTITVYPPASPRPPSSRQPPVGIIDVSKQLLQHAKEGDYRGVHNALSRGAQFTSDWLGMNALHFAAQNNHYEICDLLIKAGINKDAKTKVDRTPLHLACFNGHERIVELLLSKGCQVNVRDMLRMTPLHWAVEKKHKSIVRMLLRNNAAVDVISKFGRTPIALAVLTEQADILQELESYRRIEREKETTQAIKSITANSTKMAKRLEMDSDDEVVVEPPCSRIKLEKIDCDDSSVYDSNTVRMLKSHGITMIKDEANTSQDLLTKALQNGRQLIISEGGKLVLNDAKSCMPAMLPRTVKIVPNPNCPGRVNVMSTASRTADVLATNKANSNRSPTSNQIHPDSVNSKSRLDQCNRIVLSNAKDKGNEHNPLQVLAKSNDASTMLSSASTLSTSTASALSTATGQSAGSTSAAPMAVTTATATPAAAAATTTPATNCALNRVRPNVMKAKDIAGATSVKNKNIRIISLNDFKKMYVEPSATSSVKHIGNATCNKQLVKFLTGLNRPAANHAQHAANLNPSSSSSSSSSSQQQQQQPHNAVKDAMLNGQAVEIKEETDEDAGTLLQNIIKVMPSDGAAKCGNTAPSIIPTKAMPSKMPLNAHPASNRVPVTRIDSTTGRGILHISQTSNTNTNQTTIATSAPPTVLSTHNTSPSKVPVSVPMPMKLKPNPATTSAPLTTSLMQINANDIYRQINDLRRQNESLRRSVEAVQQENTTMRKRLERIECMLKTNATEMFTTLL